MSETAAAWWDGIPCALTPPPRYVRARGLTPSVSLVTFPRSYFRTSLAPTTPADPFALRPEQTPALLGQIHAEAPVTFRPLDRPPFVGDLVFAQGAPDAPPRTFRARQLYFVEARIVDPEHGEDAMVEVTLADIRRFWEAHGQITRSWNVLRPATEATPGTFNLTMERPAAGGELRRYEARTAKERGVQPTPLREIFQECLDALPGRLQIVRWPDDYLRDLPPIENVRAWAASPKDVLDGLMDYYRLEFDPGHDLKARFYGQGEGQVGDAEADGHGGDMVRLHDPATGQGSWAGLITADGNRYARRPSHAPLEVEVLGGRTVFDVRVDFLTPVLAVTDERPGVPPRTEVLEVTPETLAAFARGLPNELELHPDFLMPGDDRSSRLLPQAQRSQLAAVLNVLADQVTPIDPQPYGPEEGPVVVDPLFWQRLPFMDSEAWAIQFPWLSERARALLRDQLWRVYQVPESLRRLLPILKRAEVDHRGERLAPLVEAYSFRAVSNIRRKEALPPKPDMKEVLRANLDDVKAQITTLEAERERLREPDLPEIKQAVESMAARGVADFKTRTGVDLPVLRALDRQFLGPVAGFLPEGTVYALLGPLLPASSAPSPTSRDEQAARKLWDAAERFTRKWVRLGAMDPFNFFGTDTSAHDSEDVEARRRRIDERLAALRRQATEISYQIDPKLALQNALAEVEREIRAAVGRDGRVPPQLTLRREDLRTRIAQIEAEAAREEPALDDSPFLQVVRHENLPRHRVDFVVLDENLGLIKILGPLPGWLANPNLADPRGTYFVPMPVQITFGSWNRHDADLRSGLGGEVTNHYLATTVQAIASEPDLAPLVGLPGHVLPWHPGTQQVRFTFARNGPQAGGDEVGPFPHRLVIDGGHPPFQELVRLGGFTNRPQLLERVLPLARALLALPEELDAGSLTVYGPRTVLLNGRVSAVAIGYRDGAWQTDVSFDGDAAPLPGVIGAVREPGPVELTFGINVERER